MNKEQNINIIKSSIIYGDFILHSGDYSNWKCNLELIKDYYKYLMNILDPKYQVIGIETEGAKLSLSMKRFGYTISETWKGPRSFMCSLVDDVVTTESTMKKTTEYLIQYGITIGEYLCVLDRRKENEKSLDIKSIVTSKDLGLL